MGAAALAAGFLTPHALAIQYADEEFRSEPLSTGAAGNVEELRVDSGNAAQGGVVSGAGGVLKTGAGDLQLIAENTFTGGLTVREGALSFYQGGGRDDGPLGAAGGAITLDGGVLFSGNTTTLDPTRPVTIGANGGTLAGGLVINQTIAGSGPLTIENYRGWASVTLGGLQNYAGATTVSDAVFYIKGTFANSGGITLLNDSYMQVGDYGGEGARLGGTLDAINGTVGFYGDSVFDGTLNLGSDNSDSEYSHVAFFMGNSSVDNSVINVRASGEIQFDDESSLAFATIYNNGGVVDFYSALVSAASTTIINNVSPAATLIPSGCVNIETWAGPDDAFAIGHLSGSGNVYLGDSTLVLGGLDSRAMLISGTISFGSAYDYGGMLGGLRKIGDFTLTLAAANTYYGPTTLVEGKTVLDTADAISHSALVTLAANSTLVLNADNTLWNLTADSTSAALELANGVTVTLVNGITQNIDVSDDVVVTISDGTTAFAGSITGNGSVIKTGDGSLTLAGVNTYTGNTTIEEGDLVVASDSALGASTGSIAVAGELIAPTLVLAGDVAAAGRALSVAALSDPTVPNGTVSLCIDTAGHTLAIGQGLSGNGRIRVSGGGTLSIAGAIAHTDAIEITGASTLALAGAGSLGHVILADGSLAPVGPRTVVNLEWQSGGALKIDLDRGDRLNVTGIITRSGASLLNVALEKSGAWVAGETHVVATFASTTLTSADFATLALADGLTGSFAVEDNALKFTVVSNNPEPPVGGYLAWINGFGLPAADRAPSADPDGDGIPNLLEFVLMLNPTAVELEGIVATTITVGENKYPAVGFVRRRNLGEVQSAVRIYGDLKQAANINPVEVSVEARDSLSDYVIIRSSIPLAQRSAQFFRIEASAPASLASAAARSAPIVMLSNPVGAMYRDFTKGRTTTVAFPLLADVWAGIVSTASTQTITFAQELPALENGASYYLEVATGPRAGDRYDVASVSGKSARLNLAPGSYSTVKNALPRDLAGARCILREHMTLAKLGQILDAGEQDATEAAVPHRRAYKKQYLHRGKYNIRAMLHERLRHGHHHGGNSGGNQSAGMGGSHVEIYHGPMSGWVCYYPDDAGAVWTLQKNPSQHAANKAGTIIAPGTVIKIVARTSGLSLVQTGSVRTNPFSLPLARGLQLFSTGFPCEMDSDELVMTTANGWTGCLLSLLADEIYVISSKTTSSYVHYLDSKGVWRTLLGQKASIVIGPDDHIKVKRMRADADYAILPPF